MKEIMAVTLCISAKITRLYNATVKLPELIFAEYGINEWYIWGYLEYLEYAKM